MTGHSLPEVLTICAVFVGLHSFMVSHGGKSMLAGWLGRRFMQCYYRGFFVMVSALTMLGAFYLIMTLPDVYLYRAPLWLKLVLYCTQISGMVFGMMSLTVLDAVEFFGLKQMARCRALSVADQAKLTIDGLAVRSFTSKGVYALVRHPIYLAGIVMISFQPDITCNRLLVTALSDGYFLWAAFKEERALLQYEAVGYGAYRQEVPMFNLLKGLFSARVHGR